MSHGLRKFLLVFRRGLDEYVIKDFINKRYRTALIKAQTINVNKHYKYGSDVAVANFVLDYAGKRVTLLSNPTKWITGGISLEINDAIKLHTIDCSNASLQPEGIDNFVGLDYLTSLNLSSNPSLDDFACDQLSRQFRSSKTLSHIYLNNNPLISVNGLEILFRIPSIKKIVAKNTHASQFKHKELFVMLAEDERNCKVDM